MGVVGGIVCFTVSVCSTSWVPSACSTRFSSTSVDVEVPSAASTVVSVRVVDVD